MNKITTINGVLITPQDDFTGHAENKTLHTTEEERAAWNAKANSSELASKVNVEAFTAHEADATAHLTSEEREHWNASPELDAEGNMTLEGKLTATTVGSVSGAYATPMGTQVRIGAYVDTPTNADNGKTWLMFSNHEYGSYLQLWGVSNGKTQPRTLNMTHTHFIDGFTCSKGGTFSGVVNAQGGINIPLNAVETPHEALNYASSVRMKARENIRRFKSTYCSWEPINPVTPVYTLYQYYWEKVFTPNIFIPDSPSKRNNYTLISGTPAEGMTLGAIVTDAYVGIALGDYESNQYACCGTKYNLQGPEKSSMIFGGNLGYGLVSNPSSQNYTHPIHWALSGATLNDPRYPRSNSVNGGSTGREETTSYQLAFYRAGYLGSEYTSLIRGTRFDSLGTSRYCWGMVPRNIILNFIVTQGPAVNGTDDHGNDYHYYWRLFADRPARYVMHLRGSACGTGHTVAASWGLKTYGLKQNINSYVSPLGFCVTADPSLMPSGANVSKLLEEEAMRDETIRPQPSVETSATEVDSAGGEVTLTVSSALAEAVYVLNDTMGGLETSWCTQSMERVPAEGGRVTLTVAPNTTGKSREVWVFAAHHYAEAAVIKINQLA